MVGNLYISINELENFEYSKSSYSPIYCTLLFEAQKIKTSSQGNPYIWNETCRLFVFSFKISRNVTDESSMLFIELFLKNENKFIGVISLSMRKFLKETMIDSYYPLIDELGSEISNLRLHLSIQYSRIKKEEIEQEEEKNKNEEMKRNETIKKQDVVESVKMNQDSSLNANPTTQEESKNIVDPVVVDDSIEVSPVLASVDGLMLQEKRLHQIESDIIENQEELNKLKQLQFSTLSQLGSSKLDTKLHTMESQFDELNGVREIIMLNTF
jgi:hypothetical protein